MVITATAGMRGKKPIQLKQIVDKGLAQAAKLGAKVWPSMTSPQINMIFYTTLVKHRWTLTDCLFAMIHGVLTGFNSDIVAVLRAQRLWVVSACQPAALCSALCSYACSLSCACTLYQAHSVMRSGQQLLMAGWLRGIIPRSIMWRTGKTITLTHGTGPENPDGC